ncbi:MAG: hypothetical protein ABMB14_24965 [Myxococcota bacterium]
MRAMAFLALPVALAVGCNPSTGTPTTPEPTDTETGEPKILPIDTSVFIPHDSGATGAPNLQPDHYVYMSQLGIWNLSSATDPSNMSGDLRIAEYVDELDTALPVYECNVTYSLTGSAVNNHTCNGCEFVFDVEYYVTNGDPSGCHDPDTPPDGVHWQLGFDQGEDAVVLNYYGTDVWLPWYDAVKNGSTVDLEWIATLAIEIEDSGQ